LFIHDRHNQTLTILIFQEWRKRMKISSVFYQNRSRIIGAYKTEKAKTSKTGYPKNFQRKEKEQANSL